MKRIIDSLILTSAILLGSPLAQAATELVEVEAVQILQQTDVRFPGTMRAIGVKEGNVSLVVAIDREGQLQDTFVLQSSRRDFTKSALKSLSDWEFSPASYRGEPVDSSLRIDLSFQIDKKLSWQTFQAPGPADITRTENAEKPVTTSPFGELDSIPLPVEIIEPDFSAEGHATVEFYIDALGKVRCPRVTRSSSLAFGKVMFDTVSKWEFEPPIVQGTRTNTMVRQTFTYANGRLTASGTE